jgi:hypothetical protein
MIWMPAGDNWDDFTSSFINLCIQVKNKDVVGVSGHVVGRGRTNSSVSAAAHQHFMLFRLFVFNNLADPYRDN